MARTGGISTNSSGDLFITFCTAASALVEGRQQWSTLKNDDIDPLLAATAQATEEAIINALVAAETMRGIDANTFYGLPTNVCTRRSENIIALRKSSIDKAQLDLARG